MSWQWLRKQTPEGLGSDEPLTSKPNRWGCGGVQTGQAHLSLQAALSDRAGWTTGLMQQLCPTCLNVLLHTIPRHFTVPVHAVMDQIPSLALSLRCKTHGVQLLQSPKPVLPILSRSSCQLPSCQADLPGTLNTNPFKAHRRVKEREGNRSCRCALAHVHSLTSSFPVIRPSRVKVCSKPTNTWLEIPAFTSSAFSGVWWAYFLGAGSLAIPFFLFRLSVQECPSLGRGRAVLSVGRGCQEAAPHPLPLPRFWLPNPAWFNSKAQSTF